MFVVQLGHYAWLSYVVPVTTSSKHATTFATEAEAAQAVAGFKATRTQCLAHMMVPQRELYAEMEPTIVPLADLQARMSWQKERGTMALPQTVPGTPPVATPAPSDQGSEPADASTAPTPAPAPTPSATGEAPAKRGGITRAIYQWVLDNPNATKKDAQAAFPSANPSTVGVQFGAARKAGS